jgi:3-hydroxy-9,10-secoandrosta-1,3,5(10)-triene-9,17-dione monooxygenase
MTSSTASTTHGMGDGVKPATVPSQPEPTPKQLIARAVALRETLLAQQAEVEERTYYSQEMHEEFQRAGFYRMYVPRRYGGYEVDVPTYMRVLIELARGCPNTAWCMGLAANHALQIGSYFPERAQSEILGDGDFRAASVAMPVGPATRTDGGWEINGQVAYASGIPYSTHYMGQAIMPDTDPAAPEFLLFVAPRDQWTMLDDWGNLLGLKGSGSQSVRFDQCRIPAHWALERTFMVDVDVDEGTPGLELHGNPMYAGRAIGPFTICLAALIVGAAYCALDEYEVLLNTRQTRLPPFVPRREDPDFQRWFGEAWAKIATAEAALLNAADQHMELCQRFVDEGVPFGYADDVRVGCIAREAILQTWETMQGSIWRTAGSSAAGKGERIERMFRDTSMFNSHFNTQMRDAMFRNLARERLGMPRL